MAAKEFLETLKSTGEVELTVKRSEKWTTRPVWFVVDGATIYLLPMYGKDTKWYKYATTNPEIELSVRGKKARGEARQVFDAQKLADVIDQFGSKYGDLKKYYKKLDTAIAVTIET
ncbi:MAG TPA: nitroreductase/quinone reductase family protein [Candidatus Acidoferrum sp.]|nr:nitroreductase/quinone reductase family protein [Candidatus Acidoferrum sp.]